MTATPLNIDTKRLPPTPQWSPILSHSQLISSPRRPAESLSDQDLSSRCRKLARSFGESALLDDGEFYEQSQQARSRENSNETPSSPSPLSPLSVSSSPTRRHHSHHHFPLTPPTPEGGHVLNEILEEEPQFDDTVREEEEEKGLGFSRGEGGGGEGEQPMQFKLSPMMGSQMSLHGASLAMGSIGRGGEEEGGLGLSLHDHFRMDNEVEFEEEDHERNLREELKRGTTWIKIDLSLVDGELLIGTPNSQLDPSQTFSACYVEPLLRILTESTPSPASPLFTSHHHRRLSSPSSSSSSTSQTLTSSRPLHLSLSLHSHTRNPSLILQYVQASLEPLHDQHFLTFYCRNARLTTKAPIVISLSSTSTNSNSQPEEEEEEEGVIIESLNIDDEILEETLSNPRNIFRELQFREIEDDIHENKNNKGAVVNNQSHPIVSMSFKELNSSATTTTTTGGGGRGVEAQDSSLATLLSPETKTMIQEKVKRAHEKGFVIKIEGIPRFPEHLRRLIETNLKSIGVDHVL